MWIDRLTKHLWRALASAALLLGSLGVVLPGLPTVPFLILAAWAGAHGWPELEQKLLEHPRYGPMIRQWRERRAVPRRAKWLASGLMALSVATIWLLPAPQLMRWLLPAFLCVVALWLWTRPEV